MARSTITEEQVKDDDFLSPIEHEEYQHEFFDLSDTPNTYSGTAGKYVTVKEDETGLEFTPFTTMGPWVIVSSGYDASHGQNLFLDSTVSGIIVALPDNPTFGYSVAFADGASNCGTNNVTISAGSSKILGLSENFIVDEDSVSFTLNYYNETLGWVLGLVGHTTLTSTAGSWTVVDSNYTASNSDNLFMDSTVSGINITLPSNPSMGYGVAFVDAPGNCGTNNVTILGSGNKILGLSEDLSVNFDNARFTLTYYDTTNGWVLGLVGHI